MNAAGDVVEQSGRRTVAGARGPNGWLRWDPYGTANANPSEQPDDRATGPIPGANTTIGVVATNAPLDKAGATRLAGAAHDGLALAVRPAHTALDGDTFFALSTAPDGRRLWPLPPILTWAATEVTMRAILQAVQNADGRGGVPGWPNLPFAR